MKRLLRKLGASGVIIFAFSAVMVAPAAGWSDEEIILESGENPSLELTGTTAVTSSSGGVHCPSLTASLKLTGGTSDGHVQSVTAEEPGKCEVSGGLTFLTGGTTTLKSMTLTGAPTATSSEEKTVGLTGISIHYQFNNGFKFTLSSAEKPLVATPDNTVEISSLALAGELNSSLGSKGSVSGSLNVLGAAKGTYGLRERLTLSSTAIQNEAMAANCKFQNENEVCEIKISVDGAGQGWRVEKVGELKGAKAAERYEAVAVGCAKGTLLKKKGDNCVDKIKMIKKEAGTENEWCVLFESEDGKIKGDPECTKLEM